MKSSDYLPLCFVQRVWGEALPLLVAVPFLSAPTPRGRAAGARPRGRDGAASGGRAPPAGAPPRGARGRGRRRAFRRGDPAPRRASRLARVARWAVSSFAAGAGPSSRASPPRPLLASARGAGSRSRPAASCARSATRRLASLLGSWVVPADAAEARACRGCDVAAAPPRDADGSALAVGASASSPASARSCTTSAPATDPEPRARRRRRARRRPVRRSRRRRRQAAVGSSWSPPDADPPAACVQRVVEQADGIDIDCVLAR